MFSFPKFPDSWYDHVQFEIELLHSYISNLEPLITISISKFRTEKQTHGKDTDNEEVIPSCTTTYLNLNDRTFDLETVFEDYFPNLLRSSALITIYSFFEHQLEKLCKEFSSHQHTHISINDIKGKGIERSFHYLTKVAELTELNNSATWPKIKIIGQIRNMIAHNNGRVKKEDLGQYKNVPHLKFDINNEIEIQKNYLPHVLGIFGEFLNEIHRQLRMK